MRIRFSEISPHGNQFEIHSIEGIGRADQLSVDGQCQAAFELKRKNDNQVEMHGTLHAKSTITCDRCLKPFSFPLATQFHIIFEIHGEESWQLKEMECSAEELDTHFLLEPVIDIDDVLRQQALLALPTKQLCNERCKGLCNVCGADLNIMSCGCEREVTNSPFAALATLKVKKE
ncbi:MAG: hypothetical protein CSA31_02250 [Desulfobulbus propionicus]|nr:MAG: hypothetical protein CSB34_06415 [Desulfobulbus propionicus]PIE60414.1 MAG: hypothetical protein CSA31_02250 [Desulfobulbus propionicus]